MTLSRMNELHAVHLRNAADARRLMTTGRIFSRDYYRSVARNSIQAAILIRDAIETVKAKGN